MKLTKKIEGFCTVCKETKDFIIKFVGDAMECSCPDCKHIEKFPTQNRVHAFRRFAQLKLKDKTK